MNQEIRKFLIDQCIKGQPIFYEVIARKLNLNLEDISDRNIMSRVLEEISTFEYENGRPLISAIVIYKLSNDQGKGFFTLCEVLGIGTAKQLNKSFYGFTAIEACKVFWKYESNFKQFYELNSITYDEKNSPPFFNKEEINFFKSWCGRTYNSQNSDHVNAKNYLLDTVWTKTKFWSDETIKRLPDYETSNRRMWSKRGWDNGKPVSKFKEYSWARIFKKGDKAKDIFFTIGADPLYDALVYKLDFFRESESKLSVEQRELCEKHIPTQISWLEIKVSELQNLNWEKLIKLSVEFISKNTHHYEQIEKLVWGYQDPQEVFNNSLTEREYPSGRFTELPTINPTFKGQEIDFIKQNIENKELGDIGEELVKDYEMKRLRAKGMRDFADKVEIVKDGEGFDILSFDENGNEKYIEVKTTEGDEKTPFYLSRNEYLFSEKNQGKYCIYRLYNYHDEANHADYFIINEPLKNLLFEPVNYKVYLKKEK